MSAPVYRPACRDDLPAMAELFLEAAEDMLRRNGFAPSLPGRQGVLAAYGHILDTGHFELAEDGGRIVAIAGGIVRDDIWFLSSFWVRPGLQRRGLGMPLLRKVREIGRQEGARIFFTWASPDTTAIAAYMRIGLYPGHQIMIFEGAPKSQTARPVGYALGPLPVEAAMALDREIRGTARAIDQRHFADSAVMTSRLVAKAGETVGYFRRIGGLVGPALWTDPAHAEAVLALAVADALQESQTLRISVPGVNHQALGYALQRGLRLTSYAHFLTSAPFGRLDRYISSGPSLY